jgi:eukaryotic-like serine/threonine-protein kinase
MNPTMIDRDTFLQNLQVSQLLTSQQFRVVADKLGQFHDAREIAKALATWKLLTKFQAKMLLLGRTSGYFLGPYKILDLLGRGGMGRVYKAVHQTMNRVVALKVLTTQMVNTERAKELFLREVQAAAHLTHPNIVMAFDANEADGRHYLAMEYVAGPNLERHVRRQGALPVGLACEIVFQTANGLQHAFEMGMVHRDIKPANLLLHKEPGADSIQVKILDFGLARLAHRDIAASKTLATKETTVMGTPDFLSPEQSRDVHDTDIRSDLYSLGCTFYFLLTGRVPFPGGTTVDKVIRHNSEEPKALEKLRPDVPKKIAKIVRKLMAKNPDERFQTPDELMDALAPHAAPSVMDWPIAPTPAMERGSQEDIALPEVQADTEPRAHLATQIGGPDDSILEWAGMHSKHRRFRRNLVAAVFAVGAIAALGGMALAAWLLN